MFKSVIFEGKKMLTSKVVCVGRNYVEHIKELNNELPSSMVIFMKPNSSVSDELFTCKDTSVHYEAEISFIIEDGNIAGVGFGLDLTKREIQSELKKKGLPWERAKAFDNSAVFSDFVTCKDVDSLHVKLFINNKLIQYGSVSQMIYKPNNILKEITSFSSLENGDIVMTGTPKGVGVVESGDKFFGQILSGDKVLIEKEFIALKEK